MKHTLFVLAVWLMSAPDSYSQTNKMDDYIVKDASLASARRSAASIPSKPTGYMVSGDPATIAKPTVPQKLQSIIGHTQNLKNTTQVLKANTDAIEANTKALMANTEALAANMKASQNNKHMRSEQMHQATPVPPAPKVPVYSPAVLAHKSAVKPAAPTPVVMAAMPKAPATVAVVAMPKAPLPVAIAAVPKAPAKPQPAPVAKEMPKPAAPVVPIAKVPMKPIELPAGNPRVISTMPVAAAPVKAAKPSAMTENNRTFSTMAMAGNVRVVPTVANKDLPNPAAAKSTTPVEVKGNPMTAMSMVAGTVPSGKPVAAPIMPPAAPKPSAMTKPAIATATAVKMTDIVRNSKSVKITDLVQLPLMDKMYDCKISNPKYYPYASKYGLKHGDMITTQGYLQVVATEDSGKVSESYLLQLTVNTTKGDTCFMVRIPAEQLAKFGGKESLDNSKKFVRELVKGRIPCTGGNIIRKPVYVSVTGQLSYVGSRAANMRKEMVAAQGKRDMNSYTPWEINASNVAFATAQ